DLRALDRHLVVTPLVLDQRLEVEVEEQVQVGIHQTGDDVLPARVDGARRRRHLNRPRLADRGDAAVGDDHDAIGDGRLAGTVNDGGAGDGDVLRRQRSGGDEEEDGATSE